MRYIVTYPVSKKPVNCCEFFVEETTVRRGIEFPLGPMIPSASVRIDQCWFPFLAVGIVSFG